MTGRFSVNHDETNKCVPFTAFARSTTVLAENTAK
jgi:hypothetical protein